MIGLTAKQARCLDFIERYTADNDGIAPSYQQIMEALDMASKSGVHRLVIALEVKGRIRRIPDRARAIEVVSEDSLSALETMPSAALIAELARRAEFNREGARI